MDIYELITSGDLEELKLLIGNNSKVLFNFIEWTPYRTPLTHAIRQKKYEIVEFLIKEERIHRLRGDPDKRAFNIALKIGDLKSVEIFIKYGLIINDYYDIPLIKASEVGNIDIVKFLVEHGAEVNIKDPWDTTPIYAACRERNLEVVKYLIEEGANINKKINSGWTPLHTAVYNGDFQIVKLLLEKGAYTDVYSGGPIIHLSIKSTHTEILRLLLDYNANVNVINESDVPLLHYAVERGGEDIIKMLILAGADINREDDNGLKASEVTDNKNIIQILNTGKFKWSKSSHHLFKRKKRLRVKTLFKIQRRKDNPIGQIPKDVLLQICQYT